MNLRSPRVSAARLRRETKQRRELQRRRHVVGKEGSSHEYDQMFASDRLNAHAIYSLAPEQTPYYKAWKYVIGLIARRERIVEYGCGPGQFAAMAISAGLKYIRGVDFSAEAIKWAQTRNAGYTDRFVVGDVYDKASYRVRYDVAVFLETLEHLAQDLVAIRHIIPGRRVIFSVPSFGGKYHVRYFTNKEAVLGHYSPMIDIRSIVGITTSDSIYRTLWIADGTRKD